MRKLITLALLAFATACGDSTAPDASYAGTYPLRSIDGMAMPVNVYEDGADFVRVTGGSLIFDASGTFTTSLDITYSIGGVVENESEWAGGTFTRDRNRFTLTDSEGDSFIATYDGSSTMTVDADGVPFVFRR